MKPGVTFIGTGLVSMALLAGGALAQAAPAARGVDPRDREAVKVLFESWKAPEPARRLIGNIHYVGAGGVSSFLITTSEGHILLDTGFDQTVPLIQRGAEELGFGWREIKIILSSHAHADHVGGHALMKKLTGAGIVASEADARLMASGGADDFSPFPKDLMKYEAVKADRIVKDGEQVRLGNVVLTAVLTPGHTKGATTWTMKVVEAGKEYDVVFFSSVSIVQWTRLTGEGAAYAGIVEDYRRTFEKLKALPCDVFFSPHPDGFAMQRKLAGRKEGEANAFVDPEGWKALLLSSERMFLTQLEAERGR